MLGRSRGCLNSLSSAATVQQFQIWKCWWPHSFSYLPTSSVLHKKEAIYKTVQSFGKASNIHRNHAKRDKDKADVTVPFL